MLNPVLSNLSLTIDQVKKIETELQKNVAANQQDMLVLLVENSGQVIASNGNNNRNYDLASISALSVAAFESTRRLAEAMKQSFKYVFNQGSSSNLFITRATDQTILVIDYNPAVTIEDVQKVVDVFTAELQEMSKEWSIMSKMDNKPGSGKGPLSDEGLSDEIDNVFNSFN